ncbi:hypothetical protein [Mycetocola saprophilus]|uniref:hypothetical protein n=1 Tax=Mycetocola saprophilus TaxID=76636 RepID=UPI0004BE8942|nr:hypothetical protein [Mycetocola saprophilus]
MSAPEAESLRPGLYRNANGVELTVIGEVVTVGEYEAFGTLYEGTHKALAFTTEILITPAFITQCGFQFVEPEEASA